MYGVQKYSPWRHSIFRLAESDCEITVFQSSSNWCRRNLLNSVYIFSTTGITCYSTVFQTPWDEPQGFKQCYSITPNLFIISSYLAKAGFWAHQPTAVKSKIWWGLLVSESVSIYSIKGCKSGMGIKFSFSIFTQSWQQLTGCKMFYLPHCREQLPQIKNKLSLCSNKCYFCFSASEEHKAGSMSKWKSQFSLGLASLQLLSAKTQLFAEEGKEHKYKQALR